MYLLLNVKVYFLGDSRHHTKVYWHSILSRHSTFCFKWSFFIESGLDGSGKNKKMLIFPTGHVLSLKSPV